MKREKNNNNHNKNAYAYNNRLSKNLLSKSLKEIKFESHVGLLKNLAVVIVALPFNQHCFLFAKLK